MTFTFKAYYEDDSIYNYGEVKNKLVRAKSKDQALERFKEKFGIEPISIDVVIGDGSRRLC